MSEPEGLATDEPLPRSAQRHDRDRLLMLSDGVFAIAMTLLALEVRLPKNWSGDLADFRLWLTQSVATFALSFAVTAIFWTTHKRLFARVLRVDSGLTGLTLLLLGLIILLPPATILLIRLGAGAQGRDVHIGLAAAIGVAQACSWLYAGLAKLLHRSVTPRQRWAAVLSSLVMPPALSALGLHAGASKSPRAIIASLALVAGLMAGRRWLMGRNAV